MYTALQTQSRSEFFFSWSQIRIFFPGRGQSDAVMWPLKQFRLGVGTTQKKFLNLAITCNMTVLVITRIAYFSLLGFGDILVPGLLLAYCHR